MVADSKERIDNAEKIRIHIPDLYIYAGDNDNVFEKYINCFRIDKQYDGVVVLEDDIQLCNDFYNKIIEIINANKNDVISFFEKPNSKKRLQTKYCKGSEFLFNQCNYYPKSICDLLLNENNLQGFKLSYHNKYKVWIAPIDLYIGYVLDIYNIKYIMKVPFLVQHLPFKSMLGNRSTKRQTKYFIDDIWEERQ
jgi:hypothetical protein